MPFTMPHYPMLSFEQANPVMAGTKYALGMGNDFMSMLGRSLEAQKAQKLLPFVEPQAQEDLKKAQLMNVYQGLVNQYTPQDYQTQFGLRSAQTNRMNTMTPLEAEQLKLQNQFYPEKIRSDIESQQALANYRRMGGAGMGVGGKEEIMFQNLVAKDNPQLAGDPARIYEASNVLRMGGNQLSDGTQLNQLSPASRASFDRIVKQTTTSPILTGNIRANQAEAELGVLNDYANKGLAPYGDTILGYSPEQIMDTFKKDDKSQLKLGKFIASQALQFEAAQNRVRLANGQPGVTTTEELVRLSGQMIKTKYPRLSAKARQEATRYLDEALKEGLRARKSVKIGASETMQDIEGPYKKESSERKPIKIVFKNGKLVRAE